MASIPKVAARFTTTLANKITSAASSATLASATDEAGNALSGYYGLRIDPGEATEEYMLGSISGTTYTITLRGLDPVDGLTERTALKFAHRKGAPVEITDHPLLAIIRGILNGDQTIPNKLSYNAHPTFSADTELVDKKYVDDTNNTGAANSSTTTAGLVEEATQTEVDARTVTGGTGAKLFAPLDKIRASKFHDYAADAVGTDAYAITVTPAISAYSAGQVFVWKAATANTGAATLAVNGLSALPLKKNTAALVTGDITANNYVIGIVNAATDAIEVIGCAATIEGLVGVNASATTATFNESMTFFANTDITGAEAESLTGGITTPIATLHAHKIKTSNVTYNLATASGSTNYAHGLGAIPNWVRVDIIGPNGESSHGVYDRVANVQYAVYRHATTGQLATNRAGYITVSGAGDQQLEISGVDATNISVNWTRVSSPTGSAFILFTVGV